MVLDPLDGSSSNLGISVPPRYLKQDPLVLDLANRHKSYRRVVIRLSNLTKNIGILHLTDGLHPHFWVRIVESKKRKLLFGCLNGGSFVHH